MVTPTGPAVNAACGYATSAIQSLRRTLPHALRLRPLPRAAIPGRNRQGSRGRKTRPPEAHSPSDPVPRGHVPNAVPKPKQGPRMRVGQQHVRVRVHHLAGPFPRGHVPNADWEPAGNPAVSVGKQHSRWRIHGPRTQRYVTGPLPQTSSVHGLLPPLPVPPVRPALLEPVPSRCHG